MSVGLPVPLGWGSLVGLLYTLSCCQKGLMGRSGSQIETGTPFLELWWNRHKKMCKWNSLTAELLPYSRYLRKAWILTFTVPENPSVFAFNFLLRFLDGRSQAWSPLTFFFHFFFKLDSELWGGAQSIGLKAFYLNDSFILRFLILDIRECLGTHQVWFIPFLFTFTLQWLLRLLFFFKSLLNEKWTNKQGNVMCRRYSTCSQVQWTSRLAKQNLGNNWQDGRKEWMRPFFHWLMSFVAKFPPEKLKLSWVPPERLWLHPLWPTPHPPPCLLLPLNLLHQTHSPFSHHSHARIPLTAVKPRNKKAGIRCQR